MIVLIPRDFYGAVSAVQQKCSTVAPYSQGHPPRQDHHYSVCSDSEQSTSRPYAKSTVGQQRNRRVDISATGWSSYTRSRHLTRGFSTCVYTYFVCRLFLFVSVRWTTRLVVNIEMFAEGACVIHHRAHTRTVASCITIGEHGKTEVRKQLPQD